MSSSSDESPSNDSPPAPSDSGSKSSKDSPSSDEGSSKNSSKDSPSGSNDSSGSKDVSSQQSDNNNGDNNNNNNGNNGNNNNNNGDNGNKNGNNNNGNNENNNGNTGDNGNNNNNNNNNDNNNGNNGNNNNNGNNGNNNNNNGNNPSFTPPTNLGNHQVPLAPPNSNKGSGNKQVANKAHSKSSSDKGTVGGIHTNTIIGVAVAAGFVLLLLLVTIICCCRKKKKKAHRQVMYYEDHNGGGYNNYQNNYQQSPWVNNQKVPEHVVKVPPPGGGGNGGWGPNSQVYSGEASSNFSGLHQPPPPPMPHASPSFNLGFNQSTFTYEELVAATNGFSQANLLGQGGFGYVHKGVFPNGKEVAIKSLKSGSGQGEREFAAEVEIISRVHHRYLVSLVGYCIAGGQRMLVYEYVPNKTLEYHLHGKGRPVMDFPTRLRIALGSSKGLAYLHEDCHPRIIHRDIKAANILLDNNFDAMVADFGLAKLSTDNNTHVSTRVMGTFGYLAPEYASSGKLTEKSDVFSFGVMLLELITGKQPVDISMDDSLVDWARPILTKALEDGNFDELVDPRLEKNYNHNEMQRMIACAAASIRHSARKRPKMSQISRILEGDSSLDDLNEGTKPGQSAIYGASGEYNASTYNADMEKFRQLALGSQEFESNEFGRSSGENSREMGPAGVQK